MPLGYMAGMLGKSLSCKHTTSALVLSLHDIEYCYAGDFPEYEDSKSFLDSSTVAEASLKLKASERRYMWSFIGGKHGKGKNDRIHAIDVWSAWTPNHVNESVHTVEMKKVYDDSKFVIVGRGWNSIDCFRTYEVPSKHLYNAAMVC